MSSSLTVTDIIDQIHEEISDKDKMQINDILLAFRYRGYGPMLLAASILTIMPTGAIPGVPALTGIAVSFIASQLAWGKPSPWLPKRIRELSIDKKRFEEARTFTTPYTKKFDHLIQPRLSFMENDIFNRAIGFVCLLLAFSMPVLGLIPFTAFVPALAIGLFGVGLSGKDGLFIALGFANILIGGGLIVYFYFYY